ncbi:MAG: hypothetical protein K2O42_02475, partial [Oscillospiraceae bacterium]|nr:hypothetical protein [Oscillospiraceae bacterium]
TRVFLAGWITGKASNMTKGPAVKATEILFLHCIPSNLIKAILSPFVQALLSMIDTDCIRDAVLKAIIDKRLLINENFSHNYIEIIYHKQKFSYRFLENNRLFLRPLIALLDEKNPESIEIQYQKLIQEKSSIIRTVLKEILLFLYGQTGSAMTGKIPEDTGIQVLEIPDQNTMLCELKNEEKYDILAVRHKNVLYHNRDALKKINELMKEWRKS